MTAHESVFETRQRSIKVFEKYLNTFQSICINLYLNTFVHEVFVFAFVIDVY